jgi:error-prone DNA polymerase
LWEALSQDKQPKSLPLLDALSPSDEPPSQLPPMPLEDEVFADYQASGLSLKAHPISFYRSQLDELGVTPASRLAQIRNHRRVLVAGLVLLRQRPGTAKGITFATLEDETGVINLVVRKAVWERYYLAARRSPAWLAHGNLQNKDSVIHVVVSRLEDLSEHLRQLSTRSRDFR